jgi:ubiquinone biosynthesis monooxygenase Coq7
VAGLMRVNHSGEVAAQGLYQGHAAVARDPDVAREMHRAAEEETDHLRWCAQRLQELESSPSRLAPLWYAGAWTIGALSGLAGDRWSLGFIAETERQVVEHLNGHLDRLPVDDDRSRAILTRIAEEEAEHGAAATESGGSRLPAPVQGLMRTTAKIMTRTAYWI